MGASSESRFEPKLEARGRQCAESAAYLGFLIGGFVGGRDEVFVRVGDAIHEKNRRVGVDNNNSTKAMEWPRC